MAATKVEPKSQAVSPAAAANIGVQQIYTKSRPMYEGRGLEAPMVSTTSHVRGTQGKY